MNIENIKLEDIFPYEKNPRKNDKAVPYVKKSIEEFGFKVPIIIDKNNVIVAGHTRYKAAKELAMKEVPCVRADDLTDEQIKAFRVADNKVSEFSSWDFEMLIEELDGIEALDMSAFGFEDLATEEVNLQEDDFNEPLSDNPVAQRGQIWKLGEHRLMCGDSTCEADVDKLMDGMQADLVITDPPYNVNISNSKGMKIENDNMAEDEFQTFLDKAFLNLEKNLKPGGSFYVWLASRTWMFFEKALNKNNLFVRQELIWNKNALVMGRQDYQWKHEPCMYGWKEGASHYFTNDRTQTTVIDEAKPTVNDLHPTMKPLKLIGRLINNSSKEGQLVLDLFGGSGSTLMACEQAKRKCCTMEYDPKYADAIIKRWEEFTGKKAELL